MKLFYTFILALFLSTGFTQKIDFESFELPLDTFVNNSNGLGFTEEILTFNNSFNSNYMSFSEFAISTMRDTDDGSFLNQYSVISGSGAGDSDTYGIAYSFSGTAATIIDIQGGRIEDFQINNTTYAAKTIENGNAYAKKFGGESGDDPDFFLLTINFYNQGEDTGEFVEFYLADYRFEDNSMDYIVKNWTTVDLSEVVVTYDEMRYTLTSSDVGGYGINTPTYFAVDNFNTKIVSNEITELENVFIYPNPVEDLLTIDIEKAATITIFNILGNKVQSQNINSTTAIDVSNLLKGTYFLEIESERKRTIKKLIKR